jgi:hypothetical protein
LIFYGRFWNDDNAAAKLSNAGNAAELSDDVNATESA